jgi:hypothetical protein
MKASDFDPTLEELYRLSVGRLMAVEVFDLPAFERLKTYLTEKSELIKKEHVISKQVAYCLLTAAQVIESRAEHVPGVRENLRMAHDFHLILGILAWGEACSDYRPGVPRIM